MTQACLIDSVEADMEDTLDVTMRWAHPPSRLEDHGSVCCQTARSWLVAMDQSYRMEGEVRVGPSWLRSIFNWGPHVWPVYFCDLPTAEVLDCGALAAVGTELFRARGLSAITVQLVEEFSPQDVLHWKTTWASKGCPIDWIQGAFAYHEVCGVAKSEGDFEVELWDPTDCCWLDPNQSVGYGTVVGLRVEQWPELKWGKAIVRQRQWVINANRSFDEGA